MIIINVKRLLLTFLFVPLFLSCTERYSPKINGNFSVLVVDGKISNENTPIQIRLYKTISADSVTTRDSVIPEGDAFINIFSDKGDSDNFQEIEPGLYQNESSNFRGEVGASYWIKIITKDGIEYESEPEIMSPPVEITNIYGEDDKQYISKTIEQSNVKLYFDAKDQSNSVSYIKWESKEGWEWQTPFHLNVVDSLLFTSEPASVCYRQNLNNEINVYDASILDTKSMLKLPVTSILSTEQKLLFDYYLHLNVRSISSKNYQFWSHIKQINQSSGNLYDRTPGNVEGNISCCEGDHSVVGYFEVSSVSTKGKSFNREMFHTKFDYSPSECIEKSSRKIYPDTTIYYITRVGSEFGDDVFYFRPKFCYDCSFEFPITKPSFWQ
ncbi:DUF4249 domain-containing protein [Labilibaculum sp. DW002]|uniref:DUF4249 domain-containing protein n=1 Tax=Paralabilibaculum antarcticum TaxID=2912572 RepID=A0ABT5VV87_9BACT|nr:DUF4249 domain-containing protein [Labilibaculum sp. DW002]MDE5419321.1 DUF4249 domain-containing protein [Labilibaculum sp. DW002]